MQWISKASGCNFLFPFFYFLRQWWHWFNIVASSYTRSIIACGYFCPGQVSAITMVLFGLFCDNSAIVIIPYLHHWWHSPDHHAALWGNNLVSSLIHSGVGLLPHKTVWLYNYQLNSHLLRHLKKAFSPLIVVGINSLCLNAWDFSCQDFISHMDWLLSEKK